MSDNRQPEPGDSQKDSFEDALDDIFGTDDVDDSFAPQPQDPVSAYAPEPPPAVPPPPAYQPPASYPASHPPSSPTRPQRSIGRMIGIGCVVITLFGFACTIILMVIGLMVDADPNASTHIAPLLMANLVTR